MYASKVFSGIKSECRIYANEFGTFLSVVVGGGGEDIWLVPPRNPLNGGRYSSPILGISEPKQIILGFTKPKLKILAEGGGQSHQLQRNRLSPRNNLIDSTKESHKWFHQGIICRPRIHLSRFTKESSSWFHYGIIWVVPQRYHISGST